MPFLGGPYVPSSALEAVVKHVSKRARDAYEERSNVAKQQKLEERVGAKRDRYEVGDFLPDYKRSKLAGYKKTRMAYRRFRPRFARRRRYGRRRKMALYRRPRPALGAPQAMTIRVKNVLRVQLTCTGGAMDTTVYKLNSLNDPWGADGATLPTYTDQWANLYTKYKVYGTHVDIKAHAVAATGAIIVGLHQSNDATALSSADQYMTQKNANYKMFSSDIDLAELKHTYKPKKAWHLRSMRDADDQEGEFSTSPGDPTDLTYLHIWLIDAYGTDTATVECLVTFTHILKLYDPVSPAQSVL